MNDLLAQTLTLPCGAVLRNRLCKAAMTEGLADARLRATEALARLYERWSASGCGLLLTGNVQIDRNVLERPGNVAIDLGDPASTAPEALAALRRWAAAGTRDGTHLWMQISHAGRQSPRYVTNSPLGPSDVQLEMLGSFARPRALTEAEILDFIRRFAGVAAIARDTGFTGVQVHGAHGYLISSFLSPVTNRRTDAWGGSLENRARFLIETVRAVRAAVGADFPVSVKLNSDDFRKNGFSNEECVQVVRWLNDESLDLLEISGGTYEQPRLLGFSGKADSAKPEQRESTRRREAYFLDYAARIRAVATMPLMVTGGFRTRAAMLAALEAGDCHVIGFARPLCTDLEAPRQLLEGRLDALPAREHELVLARSGPFSPTGKSDTLRLLNLLGTQGWYYHQIRRLGAGLAPDLRRGMLRSLLGYFAEEWGAAWRRHRARRGHAPA